jgi:hypothetical protein
MAEDIGILFNTKIPSLSDTADIQDAIKLYHYGSTTYNTNNIDPLQLPNPSIARYLATIQGQINEILASGIGSDFTSTQPPAPDDGFVWMDADSSVSPEVIYSTAIYSDEAPTENLVNGIIWIDRDSTANDAYVWNASTLAWDKISQTLSGGEPDEILLIMGVY